MVKKQRTIIIICLSVIAVLAIVWFAVISPLVRSGGTDEAEPPELLDGELIGTSNRIMMFEHIEKAEIDSIKVHNEYGDFEIYRTGAENFYFKGLEGVPYSNETLSGIITAVGYPLTMDRVETDCKDLSEFGLSEKDSPSYYIIKKLDGTEYKVYIGKALLSGGGYYTRVDGRNAVYIMDTTYQKTVLCSVYNLLSPTLGYPISTNPYALIDDFTVMKKNSEGVCERFLWIDKIDDAQNSLSVNFKMLFPNDYPVNTTKYADAMTVIGSLAGDKVLEAEAVGEEFNFDILKEKYGIDVANPEYEIDYSVNSIKIMILFSKPDDNGDMNAYTSLYNMVVKINKSEIALLDWDLIDWVDDTVYLVDINKVSELTIKSEQINVSFFLEDENTDLKVRIGENGKVFDKDELANFRRFYASLLLQVRRGYTDSDSTDESKLMATIFISFRDGTEKEYKYYAYSTRRCFYTINGKGEFYMLRDELQKILNDAERVVNGEQVDYEDKN